MLYFLKKDERESGRNFHFMVFIHRCRWSSLSMSMARFIFIYSTFSFICSFIHSSNITNWKRCLEDSPEEIRSFYKPIYDQSSKLSHISANDKQNKRWLTLSEFSFKKYLSSSSLKNYYQWINWSLKYLLYLTSLFLIFIVFFQNAHRR